MRFIKLLSYVIPLCTFAVIMERRQLYYSHHMKIEIIAINTKTGMHLLNRTREPGLPQPKLSAIEQPPKIHWRELG